MPKQTEHGIGTRTFRGMVWSYGSFFGVRFASLVTTAILARLLVPKDFGLIALATTFMAFLDMLQGLGVSQALVVSDESQLDAEADTAFAISSLVGIGLWLLSAALGPVAAALFHQPRLVEIMPVLGLTFVMYGLGATHYALAMRAIDFRSRTAAELADALFRGAVGIVLALSGLGVWSLVCGYVAGTAAMTVVLWRMVRWRPRLRPQRRHLRKLLSFGGALTGVAIMGAFLNQFDNALVGRVLGSTQLGFYSIAGRLPYLFIISLAVATGQVLFPAFASLKGEGMRRGFLISMRYTAVISLPLTALLITLAQPITLAVFGPQWRPAVTATQVLCLWALMSPVSMVCGNAIKACGRAWLLFMLAVPQAIALIAGSLLFVHDGIVAVAWVQVAIAVVAQVVTLWIVGRMLELRPRRVLSTLGPPALAAGGLALVLFEIQQHLHDPWVTVIAGGVAAAIIYPALVRLLMPDLVGGLLTMAFPGRRAATDSGPETSPPSDGDDSDSPSSRVDAAVPTPPASGAAR